MAAVVIKQCTCTHEFQDKQYGKKNRVCNPSGDEKSVYCTVCGKEFKS